jgi:SpoVK/Ycf46/Vps4 family AAA+-type ATPase
MRKPETGATQPSSRPKQVVERLEATANWNDLTLPASDRKRLREIAERAKRRTTTGKSHGHSSRTSPGSGVTALFVGPSGAGKTNAAAVIANELNLPLYRIDVGRIVSKYIGETEKNLRRVFESAELSDAVLLFDEADALFGKRTEVKDSHDRYANVEISYLLQRVEAYEGVVILATNTASVLAEASLCRSDCVVKFPAVGRPAKCE